MSSHLRISRDREREREEKNLTRAAPPFAQIVDQEAVKIVSDTNDYTRLSDELGRAIKTLWADPAMQLVCS
jgi:hypothetical protein